MSFSTLSQAFICSWSYRRFSTLIWETRLKIKILGQPKKTALAMGKTRRSVVGSQLLKLLNSWKTLWYASVQVSFSSYIVKNLLWTKQITKAQLLLYSIPKWRRKVWRRCESTAIVRENHRILNLKATAY